MSDPTPGPWKVRGCAGGYLIEALGKPTDTLFELPADAPRFRVVRGAGGIERLADATLIAEAPTLLAACEHAASAIHELINASGEQTYDDAIRALDQLRTAIKQAYGQHNPLFSTKERDQ